MKSDGSIWFTDPAYGIESDYEGDKAESEIGACHVYRVDPGTGEVEAVITDMVRPNGIAFSLDESQLYVVDTGRTHGAHHPAHMRVFDVDARARRSRAARSSPTAPPASSTASGWTSEGRIWTSAGDGIHCYDSGRHADRQDQGAGSRRQLSCFGGAKRNCLYICGTTSLYMVRLMVNGAKTY